MQLNGDRGKVICLENSIPKAKVSKRAAIKDVFSGIGELLTQVTCVLEDHEKRMQTLEASELKAELKQLEDQIGEIADVKKRAEALASFKSMCELLGIFNLEN